MWRRSEGSSSCASGSGCDGTGGRDAFGGKPLQAFLHVGNLSCWSRGREARRHPSGNDRLNDSATERETTWPPKFEAPRR